MTKVICKASVRVEEFTPELLFILNKLVFSDLGRLFVRETIVVTSISDGKIFDGRGNLVRSIHKPTSKHYESKAIDIRSKNIQLTENKHKFRGEFEDMLGEHFVVLFEGEGTENEHFHVQSKRGFEVSIDGKVGLIPVVDAQPELPATRPV